MPTMECLIGELKGELKALSEERRKEAADWAAEKEELFTRLRKLEARDNQIAGAQWALAKVGAIVVAVLTGVGFLATHGVPEFIKNALK